MLFLMNFSIFFQFKKIGFFDISLVCASIFFSIHWRVEKLRFVKSSWFHICHIARIVFQAHCKRSNFKLLYFREKKCSYFHKKFPSLNKNKNCKILLGLHHFPQTAQLYLEQTTCIRLHLGLILLCSDIFLIIDQCIFFTSGMDLIFWSMCSKIALCSWFGQPGLYLIFILSKNKGFESGTLLKMPPSSFSLEKFDLNL